MRRRLALVLTLAAWLLATGSHWDVVQVYAYARMFVTQAHTLPLNQALNRTFSAEGRCDICSAVDAARQAPDRANAPASAEKFAGKIPLTHEPAARFVFAPAPVPLRPDSAANPLSAPRAAPPLPPPRA